MKKILLVFFSCIFYYLIITFVVFSFSYISLINGKTYDLFWIKSIQKKIYFRGYRNIWQNKKECVIFDEHLLYKPKPGYCNFQNPEFQTSLKFNEHLRIYDNIDIKPSNDENIIVLGDSHAMGWGVNDNETFPYYLEKSLEKKVFNMGVSSYGTVRQIKRLKSSPYFKTKNTIIIQYHPNDLYENKELDFNKSFLKKEFEEIFNYENTKINSIIFILRNYKSSIRLFFSDILDIMFKDNNLEIINFLEHKKYLEKLIIDHININETKVLIVFPSHPWQKVINFPENNNDIEYLLIKLDKSDFFIIDDHPNKVGHLKIANVISNYLLSN